MATPKQTIQDNLAKLETLYAQRDDLKSAQNRQIDKHLKTFNEATKPINERFEKKLAPVQSQIAEIEKEIFDAFEKTRQSDGSFKLAKVEVGSLSAESVSTQSAREVDAKSFFDSVPALKRNAVWDSFKVLVGKAEKLVGKETLDKIAKVTTSWSVRIRKTN